MAITHHADLSVAEAVLARLKDAGGVAPDAQLAGDFYSRLRREVLPRDLDFLHMSGRRPIVAEGCSIEDGAPIDPNTIDLAMQRLKRTGFVAQDAWFNGEAPHRLAPEVGYRDFHFLFYLGRYAETEVCAGVLGCLQQLGIAPPGAGYSAQAFERLRREVRSCFEVPDTAMSRVMERLLYMLCALRRPSRMIGIGTYCGNTLAWAAGASCNGGRVYEAEKVYGIDIDTEATRLARRNFSRLSGIEHIELIAEDGRVAAERLTGPFDAIYLDANSPDNGKAIYLELIQRLYPKLVPGGWVVAHDTTLPAFREQLAGYLTFVRDRSRFAESVCLDVDLFGLELSVK